MPILRTSRAWTRQPPNLEACRIDSKWNPDVVIVPSRAYGYDLVRSIASTYGTDRINGYGASKAGLALIGNAASSRFWLFPTNKASFNNGITFVFVGEFVGDGILVRDETTTGGSIPIWRSSGNLQTRLSAFSVVYSTGYAPVNQPICIVLSAYNGINGRLNAAVDGRGYSSEFNPPLEDPKLTWALFKNGANAAYYDGSCSLFAVLNKKLSVGECVKLSLNPWQIFKPANRVLYFPVSSAGYYDEYLSLSAVLSQEQSRTADYSAGLSLTAAAGAMSGPNATMNSVLTLPTVAAVEPGTTAVMNPTLALDLRALLSSSGAGVYARALELSTTLGAVVNWDTSIEATLNLATALALSDSVLRTTDASLPLGVMIDTLSAAVANMSDTISLGLSVGQTLSGGLDLSAELSLAWSLAMTETGATWEIATTMPNGRVITIAASERLVTIAASNRTITVH